MTTATIAHIPTHRTAALDSAPMGHRLTSGEIDRLGEAIASDGSRAHEGDVQYLVAMIRRLGLASAALDVLADESAPEVVRTRAFLVVASRLHTPRVPSQARQSAPVPSGSPSASAKASTQAA